MKALDLSYSNLAELSDPDGWVQRRKAEGYGLAIQCSLAWPGYPDPIEHAGSNLAILRRNGLLTATYQAYGPGGSARDQVLMGREVCGDEWQHCAWNALDIEVAMEDALAFCDIARDVTHELGLPHIWYSSISKWRSITGDSQRYAGDPMWSADWDGSPLMGGWTYQYGGFNIIGKQYSGDRGLEHVAIDINEFDDAWLGTMAVGEELTMAQFDEIMAVLARLEQSHSRIETALYGDFTYTDSNGVELHWRNVVQLLMEAAGKGDGMDYEAIIARLNELSQVDAQAVVDELAARLQGPRPEGGQ